MADISTLVEINCRFSSFVLRPYLNVITSNLIIIIIIIMSCCHFVPYENFGRNRVSLGAIMKNKNLFIQ